MARAWNKLTANAVRGATKRGRYSDGGNLYLQVAKGGTAAWVFSISATASSARWASARLRSVPLALARELAAQAREQLARGLDPMDARKAAGLAEQAARARLMTFKQCAEEYHAANLTRWRNAEAPRRMAISALRRYAFPMLGHLSVDVIDSGLVHACWRRWWRQSRSPRRGCAGASKRCWTTPRQPDGAAAKTPPTRPSSCTCCRCDRKRPTSHINRRCRYAKLPALMRRCARRRARRRGCLS